MPCWVKLVWLKLLVFSPPGSCITDAEEPELVGRHKLGRNSSSVLLGHPSNHLWSLVLATNLPGLVLNLGAKRSTSGVIHPWQIALNTLGWWDLCPGINWWWLRNSTCQFSTPGICTADRVGTWCSAQAKIQSTSIWAILLLVPSWWLIYATTVALSNWIIWLKAPTVDLSSKTAWDEQPEA